MDSKTKLLSRVPLFAGLDEDGLAKVASLTDEVDLRAGTQLLQEGAFPYEFFLIVEGSVAIDRDGAQVSTLGPGDFLGEIALVDGGRRTASARAETDVRVLVLGRREFHTLVNQFPEVRESVLSALAERVRRLDTSAD